MRVVRKGRREDDNGRQQHKQRKPQADGFRNYQKTAYTVSAEELLREYCTWVYAGCGSYVEAARILGLDRRTVRARVDEERLRQLQGEAGEAG